MVKSHFSSFPRFSFIIIALNAMPFLEFVVKGIYDFAHEIIVVEGAVEKCMFAANPDGSSKDGTVEFMKSYPDLAGKIRFIQGKWPEKLDMENAGLQYVTGDYVWIAGSDEFYKEKDLYRIKYMIQNDPGITQINFIPDNFWKGFEYIFLSSRFFEDETHYRRIFKYQPGARFTSHRPPAFVYPGSNLTSAQIRLVDGFTTRQLGIILYHYSYVLHSQVDQKINLYHRYGWGKVWNLNLDEWYHKCFLAWRPESRAEIESRYPVWTGDKNSLTVRFNGTHPDVIQPFIRQFERRATPASGSAGAMNQVIPSRWGNRGRIKQAHGRPAAAVSFSSGKPGIAGIDNSSADLTEVSSHSRFVDEVQKLFAKIRPRKIIETGTYLGTGTTTIIASSLRQLGIRDATFYTIEVNPLHYRRAMANLKAGGLLGYVSPLNGLTLPRGMLPTMEEIEDKYVQNIESENIFVDHAEGERAALYYKETNFDHVPDDMLDNCLMKFEYRPDFVLLDSAGHIGNIEFDYLVSKLRGPCHIALDDIFHVKHHEDFLMMQTDPRFEIVVYSGEKFGFCIAKYTPQNQAGTAEVKDLLWIRTDSIGDAVLSLSMLPHIKLRYPSAKISVLCQEHIAELYHPCSYVDEVITFDRQKIYESPEYRDAVSAKLVRLNADLMLNSVYSRDLLSDYFSIGSGARERIGMDGDLSNISENARQSNNGHYTNLLSSPGNWKPELERHKDFLSGLSIEAEGLKPDIPLTCEDIDFADQFFGKNSIDPHHTIALFAGAQCGVRLYDLYGEALAGICREEGYTLLAIGSRGDYGINQQCLDTAGVRSINLCGTTTLRQSAALLSKCRLAVGAETGLAHIACAVGTPNVILLGGGHFGRFMPYSPLTTIACLPLDCYGCNWNCKYARPHCVRDLKPQILAEAILKALRAPGPKPRVLMQDTSLWPSEAGLPKWRHPGGLIDPESITVELTGGAPRGSESVPEPEKAVTRNFAPIEAAPPLITAIVSTYNAERFLRGCLEDLEAQTVSDKVEILVIDSGSEQNERGIVEEFRQKYHNIRYVRTERESLYAAWNRGIRLAAGKYITNANTDDRHRNDAFEIQLKTLEENPGVDLVYGDCFVSNKLNETFSENQKQEGLCYPVFFAPDVLFRYQFGPQPMWRKGVHEQLGFFDERFRAAGDYEFNIRFCFQKKAMHIPEFLGLYLKHEGALSFKDSTTARETRWTIGRYRTIENVERLYVQEGIACNSAEERSRVHLDFGTRLLQCHVPVSWFHLRRTRQEISGEFTAHLAFASRCFISSSRLAPGWVAPYNNLAVDLYLMDLPEKATSLLDKAYRDIPHPHLQFNREIISAAKEEEWKYSRLKFMDSGISAPVFTTRSI
ncbi:MAG: glycosyltransferase [Syntrophobacteraceae bacterium]